MSVIGFDIGNESCVIATAKRGGIDILLNDEAKRETASVVSFGDKQRFLGSAGAAFATSNPKSTITQIKRLIGRLYNEPSVQEELKLLPYVTSQGPRGGILVELEYLNTKWTFSPVEILGMLFTHLKQVAEKNLESPVVDCVIGIPSYFTDLQRREYLDAACIAGLKTLNLIHDGTAIALGYGLYKTDLSTSRPTIVVFVDIGHCDTQVTVAAFELGGMVILSHCFDPNLGGRDFDEVLFRHFAAQFKEKYNIDVYSNARASIRLRASCEKVKKILSANSEAQISIECLIGDTDVRGSITREEFEKLSLELLERVTVPCCKAVIDSGITLDRIYTVELVGSGSRIPAIMKILTEVFHIEPTRTLNGSECVARGCALRCAMLSPALQVRDYKVCDYFPYSIGVPAADRGKNKIRKDITVFSKGSPTPSLRSIKYDGKVPFHIKVSYTDKTDFPAGLSPKVGHFMIVPSQSSGEENVRVIIDVKLNDNGVVEIESASLLENKLSSRKNACSSLDKEMGSSHISNFAFSKNLDFTTSEFELYEAQQRERMLSEQDNKIEQIKDQRNTLESFVYDTRSKLSNAYRRYASDSEKKVITNSLQETEDWLYEDSDDEYEQDYAGKLKDLKQLLEPVVNRYKVEKAKTEATKYLLTCIGEYRSAADYLPSIQKQEVNNECDQAEKFLNRVQNHSYTKNSDPGEWSSIIEHGVVFLKWNCKVIMTPNRSFPVYSNQKHQPVDSNQRYQSMDVKQKDRYVESNKRYGYVNSNQGDHPGYSKQRDLYEDFNQNQHVDSNHRHQRVVSNHKDQSGDSNQRDQPADSNQMGGDSNQGDQAVDSNQMGPPVDSDQSDKHKDSDQRDKNVDSDQMGGDSNQGDQLVDSNQMGGDSYQGDHAADSNQMGPLANSDQRDKHEDSDQSDKHKDSDQRDKNGDSDQMGGDSNQGNQVADSNQMGPPVDSVQKDKHEDSDQMGGDSNQGNQAADSNQMGPPVDSVQKDKHEDSDPSVKHEHSDERDKNMDSYEMGGDSNQGNQVADSNQMAPPVDSDQKDKYEDSDQRDKHEESDQRDKNVDSDQMSVHSNQMGPPLDSDQRDKHEDSDQKETNPKTRTKETKTCTRTKETVDSAPKDQLGDMQLC